MKAFILLFIIRMYLYKAKQFNIRKKSCEPRKGFLLKADFFKVEVIVK